MQVRPRRAATALPGPAAKTIDQIRPIRDAIADLVRQLITELTGSRSTSRGKQAGGASCLFISRRAAQEEREGVALLAGQRWRSIH